MGYWFNKYGSQPAPSPTPTVAPQAPVTPVVQSKAPVATPNVYNRGVLGFLNKAGRAVGKVGEKVTGFAGEIGKTFGRTGVTATKTTQSVAGLIAYGAAVAKGDRALAQRILNANPAAETQLKKMLHDNKVTLPAFGETQAYAPPKDIKGMSQYIGAGAEIGAWLAPMGAAAIAKGSAVPAIAAAPKIVRIGRTANAVAKAKTAFKAGVREAGPLFASFSGGHEAQREESNFKTIALQTAGGYVTGVGFSTLGGFVTGMLAKQPKGVKAGIDAFTRSMQTSGGKAVKETLAQAQAGLAYSPQGQRLSGKLVTSVIKDAQAQLDGATMTALVPNEAKRKALVAGLERLKGGQYNNLAELAAAIDKVAANAPLEVRNLVVRQGFASLPTMLTDKAVGGQAAGQMFVSAKGKIKPPAVSSVDLSDKAFAPKKVAPKPNTMVIYRSDRAAGGNALGKGTYGSTDPALAQTYARQQGGKVIKVEVPKPSKILKINSDKRYQEVVLQGQRLALKSGKTNVSAGDAVKLYAESKGYQAVDATGLGDATGLVVYTQPKPVTKPVPRTVPAPKSGQPVKPQTPAVQRQGLGPSQTKEIVVGGSSAKPLTQTEQTVKGTKDILRGGQTKERGFVTHVKTAPSTPDRLKKVVSGEYVPKSTSELRAAARDLIRLDPKAAEGIALNPQSDVHVQVGNELLAHYAATGQTAKAKALAKGMAESGTEFGRAVQAFANYDLATPEGAMKFAQSKVMAYNKANPTKMLELSDRQVQSVFDRAKRVQKMAEGRNRNIATAELVEDINNLIPSSITDKAITVWKAGLLTSLRTHERNILGNFLHSIGESVKDAPAVINDMILGKRTGQRTVTFTLKAGTYTRKGVQAAKDMFYRGFDPDKTIEKFDVRHVTWDNTPWQQFLKKSTNLVFRTLGAEDKVFYNRAFGRSLYDQAGAAAINAGKKGNKAFIEALVKKPGKAMIEEATKDAQRAVFQNTNAVREVISAAKLNMSRSEATKFVSEFLMPFTGVPSSIAGEIVAYSPVGLLRGVIGSAKILANPNIASPAMQRAVSQQVGRGVVGSGILGAGAYLAKRGLMTGEPKDTKERDQWELEGKQPNSILVGGKWRSINSVGPELIILLAGAEWSRQNKTKGNPFSEKVGNTAGYLAKAFTNQTFLAGIQQPLAVITDPKQNKPTRYIGSQIASWIPNIIKDTARSLDTNERETNALLDQTVASIPFARSSLLVRRNVLGQALPNEQRGVASFVDLFRSKSPVKNPVIQEMTRLYNLGTTVTPSRIGANQTFLGASIKLNPRLLDTLEKESGGQTMVLLTALINTDMYKQANDVKKKKYIDTVVDVVRRVVKQKHLLPVLSEKLKTDQEVLDLLNQ